MRLAQLLELAPWAETEACFRRAYCGERRPKDQDDDEFVDDDDFVLLHEYVYLQLFPLSPEPSDVVIDITREGDAAVDVSGIEPETKKRLGLSLTRWEEWLGMKIAPPVLQRFSAPEIVAHCLHEMSFHGYEQDEIARYRADLQRKVDATRHGTIDTVEVDLRSFPDLLRCFPDLDKEASDPDRLTVHIHPEALQSLLDLTREASDPDDDVDDDGADR